MHASVQEAEKVCNWSWPFVAMIDVRGKLKQNFVKAAIRIAVIELSTYENVCTQRHNKMRGIDKMNNI